MDVQMPGMDGLSAATAIRRREGASGTHVPIVAMTAHAMKGDRERCLAAGMDGYLSKPVRPDELAAAIDRFCSPGAGRTRTPPAGSAPEPRAAGDDNIVIDVERTLASLGGDRRLLDELVAIFRTDSRRLMAAIRRAASAGDREALRRGAHALKGSLGTLGAPRAFRAAAGLEQAARRDAGPDARALADTLAREMTRLRRALAAFARRRPRARRPARSVSRRAT